MGAGNKTILLRCEEDGAAFIEITGPEMGAAYVCPVCGSGIKHEDIGKNPVRLVKGFLSKEQLIQLREQRRLAGNNGL